MLKALPSVLLSYSFWEHIENRRKHWYVGLFLKALRFHRRPLIAIEWDRRPRIAIGDWAFNLKTPYHDRRPYFTTDRWSDRG